jgi:hypothetical protein
MTASSTRCLRSLESLAALLVLCVGLAAAPPARADRIDAKKANLEAAEGGYLLEADFQIDLTPPLEEALNKGVPLYFTFEFELIRPRWYWFNEKIAGARQQYRLSYNALTRQYRVAVRALHQNFATLAEALEFMSRVRLREIVEPGAFSHGSTYTAAVRLRLDTSQLPRPFQITAIGSRDWSIGSDWHRWTVSP